jgi:diadenosine tetraphosphate (Ap4A) HIT family hydrolase
MTDSFVLDPQLKRDTITVGDLALSRVLLVNDANFPWLILVPRQPDVSEIIDLKDSDQILLTGEIAAVGHVLKSITGCQKLNIAALGNVVAQLHVHVIGRNADDPAWPKPVWGLLPPRAYDPDTRDGLVATLRRRLLIAAPGG